MASLYRARRSGVRGFAREVAIKVVHEQIADQEDFQKMFVDEAILSSHLHHPNIVHVEEFGESDGRMFLVMEFVDGCALSDLLRHLRRNGRVLSVPHAVRIALEVASALNAAHEAVDGDGRHLAVVHRDVSPGNILISRAGHVKMIDFGIAKSKVKEADSVSGNFKGKFRYMSPEQATGRDLDRRSDVYSLGLVLWELLAGRPALRATSDLGVLELARNPTIPPPSLYRDTVVPLELDEVVLEALEKSREDRPETATEFRRRLTTACPEALRVEAQTLGELVKTVPFKRPRRLAGPASMPPPLPGPARGTQTLPPRSRTSSVPAPPPRLQGSDGELPASQAGVDFEADAFEDEDVETVARDLRAADSLPDLSLNPGEEEEGAQTVADPSLEIAFAELVAAGDVESAAHSAPAISAPPLAPRPAAIPPADRRRLERSVIRRRRALAFLVPMVAAGVAAFTGTAIALVAARSSQTPPAAAVAASPPEPSAAQPTPILSAPARPAPAPR